MKLALLCIAILAGSLSSRADELHSALSAEAFVFQTQSTGLLHEDLSSFRPGLMINYSYAILRSFRANGFFAASADSKFTLYGVGLSYDFYHRSVDRRMDEDGTEYVTFEKWKPYASLGIGRGSFESHVTIGRIDDFIQEDTLAFMGRIGVGFALNRTIDLTGSALFCAGSSSTLNAKAYGVTIGFVVNFY